MDPSGGGGVGGISDEQMWVWGLRLRGFTARPGGGGCADWGGAGFDLVVETAAMGRGDWNPGGFVASFWGSRGGDGEVLWFWRFGVVSLVDLGVIGSG